MKEGTAPLTVATIEPSQILQVELVTLKLEVIAVGAKISNVSIIEQPTPSVMVTVYPLPAQTFAIESLSGPIGVPVDQL